MKIFIDASIVLAALGSKTGGSSVVIELVKKKKIQGVISQSVVEEVLRNTPKINSTQEEAVKLINDNLLEVIAAPTAAEVEKQSKFTAEKDAHVLASAINCKAKIIVTLDKKHLLSKKIKGLTIVTPAELLEEL